MAALVELTDHAAPAGKRGAALLRSLRGMGRVIVAFSGGTDSAYLAWAANHVAGRQTRWPSRPIRLRCRNPTSAMPRRSCSGSASPTSTSRRTSSTTPITRRNDARPLLPLQGRAVHPPGAGGPRARIPAHHLRRERGRSGRLPPGPERREEASGGRAAGRCRPDQGRDPRTLPPGGPAHLGPPGVGVPEFPHSLRDARSPSRT